MTDREPLNAAEERLWRALAEIVLTLPRALEDEFMRETGLSLTEYSVLVSLSETLDREQRLSVLARSTGLSQSRISRLVGGMQERGLVSRRPCPDDGRGSFAVLTDLGLSTLGAAYPGHLHRVRAHVFDHLDDAEVDALSPLVAKIADTLRGRGGESLR